MKLSEAFLNLYDKTAGLCKTSSGSFVICEAASDAKLQKLTITASGDFVCFGDALVKGRGDFKKRTTRIEDKDCDGIAFYIDNSNTEQLLFVDLKSKLWAGTLTKALAQATMSFLKVYSWLTLCDTGTLETAPVHFVVACSEIKFDVEENWSKSQAEELESTNPLRNMSELRAKLKQVGIAEIELGLLNCVKDVGLGKDLCERPIIVHLVNSDSDPAVLLNL